MKCMKEGKLLQWLQVAGWERACRLQSRRKPRITLMTRMASPTKRVRPYHETPSVLLALSVVPFLPIFDATACGTEFCHSFHRYSTPLTPKHPTPFMAFMLFMVSNQSESSNPPDLNRPFQRQSTLIGRRHPVCGIRPCRRAAHPAASDVRNASGNPDRAPRPTRPPAAVRTMR